MDIQEEHNILVFVLDVVVFPIVVFPSAVCIVLYICLLNPFQTYRRENKIRR